MALKSCCKQNFERAVSYYSNIGKITATTTSASRSFTRTHCDRKEQKLSGLSDDSKWPDELLGVVNPRDKKFPLPGNSGIPDFIISDFANSADIQQQASADVLDEAYSRHLSTISQLIAESDYLEADDILEGSSGDMHDEDADITDSIIKKYFDGASVEVKIQDCPKLLYKDFKCIFLEMPARHVSVLTITQRTENAMSGWSGEVEAEREQLLEKFISTATEICHSLRAKNIWCDFIDPSSGQAYFGPYSNSTLFETDDRYNSLGFRIEDLGCCKVITHKKWGENVFVGSIVTTANRNHPAIASILEAAS